MTTPLPPIVPADSVRGHLANAVQALASIIVEAPQLPDETTADLVRVRNRVQLALDAIDDLRAILPAAQAWQVRKQVLDRLYSIPDRR